LLSTIFSNILTHPEDPKYKKVSIDKVVPRLKDAKGAVELLEVLFVKEDAHYVWKGADLSPLSQALTAMNALAPPAAAEPKANGACCSGTEAPTNGACCATPATRDACCAGKTAAGGACCTTAPAKTAGQLELERVQAGNSARLAAIKSKKDAERDKLRQQIAVSRKEKALDAHDRPAVTSVAKDLKFGATEKKVQCSSKGG